ncbi:AtpZ/AtpI family protein [Jannaschia sp. LMIT008]|uniref:AtpZ/AtpI family protein n=1 Tax=Jannaschia maritima TaxID=3032585 RepID=UPI002811C0D4|nr:AtpZ/AtpI family protein [Jannaschia sp. LMIT008]
MADRSDAERMRALNARLAAARPDAPRPHMEEHYSQAQLAWRMVVELVAGLGIGFGIGYGLDVLLGTTPWLMVIFVFLGFAAGVKTMIASAQEAQGTASLKAALEEPGAGAPTKDEDR